MRYRAIYRAIAQRFAMAEIALTKDLPTWASS